MIYIPSKAIGHVTLSKEELKTDKLSSRHYEDCAIGEKAVYLHSFGLSRITYVPLSQITRVYKRLAVTKGFFEEGKIYGTLSYLVICYDGVEKPIRFAHEEALDAMLSDIREHTDIPVGKIAA